jgi:hypothetical protein
MRVNTATHVLLENDLPAGALELKWFKFWSRTPRQTAAGGITHNADDYVGLSLQVGSNCLPVGRARDAPCHAKFNHI